MNCSCKQITRLGYGTFIIRVDADHVDEVIAEKARRRERSRRAEIYKQTREAA